MSIPNPQFEPYRVRAVDPIQVTTPKQRRRYLEEAKFDLFRIPADRVMIDLLTDSGTGAMSTRQWGAMLQGDESYAGSSSYHRLIDVCRRVFGMSNVLPTHQGRVSERLLVEAVIGKFPAGQGLVVPNNAHFDSTRAMIEASGAEAIDLLREGGDDPLLDAPFKGDMDIRKLEHLLRMRGDDVPFVMVTVTCNSNGGQPVSMANLRAVRDVCDRFGKMLILDACRYAENAWFIKTRETGFEELPVPDIAREMFDLCDGISMSTRKDGLSNVGGLLMLTDDEMFRRACDLCIVTQGFSMTYGSLPGRDLEAIAVGLQEVMDETYLCQRAATIDELAARLRSGGVPIVEPAGGHAVFIDAIGFCDHLSRDEQPGQALACALYEFGGIRACSVGSVLKRAATLPRNGHLESMELVRLAIPRRTYTRAHLQHVANVIVELKKISHEIEPRPAQFTGTSRFERELELA